MFNSTPSSKPLHSNSPQVLDRSNEINIRHVPLIFNAIGDYLVLDLELCKTAAEYGYILTFTIFLQNVLSRLGIDLKKYQCIYCNKHMNTSERTFAALGPL
jgi:hypothetical protein